VAIIVEENRAYGTIVGSNQAPYIHRTLIAHGALLTNYYAITHPSLPNYLALDSGSTQGCTSDVCGSYGARDLGGQLTRAGKSWAGYMESMPRPCARASSGQYAAKHNPFVHFTDVLKNRCAGHVLPMPKRIPSSLRRFTWFAPNLLNDTDDGTIQRGDTWLKDHVPAIMRALGPRGLLIVTWDEGSYSQRVSHIATILYGPIVRHGIKISRRVNHYSLLRLIESRLRVSHLGKARRATRIRGWHR
jgi:acid phosphatase